MAKGPEAFRTISEAADELNVPQHVLRFWETKFSFIRPMKRAGGRTYNRPHDIVVLRGVRTLLHDAGYTIKGVQKLHKDQGLKPLLAAADGDVGPRPEGLAIDLANGDLTEEGRERLLFALEDLQVAKRRLDTLLDKS